MELILVRHALPEHVVVETGTADPPLSSDGVAQADLCADYLAAEHIDALYSSPMRRARQTAEPIAVALDLPVTIADGVAEFDADAKEYVPMEQLKERRDPRLEADNIDAWAQDGTDFAAFQSRALETLDAIIADHRSQRVVVVCHGGVINVWLAKVLGLPYERSMFFPPNYTSIHRTMHSSRGGGTIVSINETPHLRLTGLPMGMFEVPARQVGRP